MTTPELITDEIVKKAVIAHRDSAPNSSLVCLNGMRAALLAVQDDMTRPVYNLLRGWKCSAEAYKIALEDIRYYYQATSTGVEPAQEIANAALRGDYHRTDFTEFCKQNPIDSSQTEGKNYKHEKQEHKTQ